MELYKSNPARPFILPIEMIFNGSDLWIRL